MSVTLNVCRTVVCHQSDCYHSVNQDGDVPVRTYALVEVITTGWEQGARYRQKRFPSFLRLFGYLNKLHIHGFLDDTSYHAAWSMVLEVETFTRSYTAAHMTRSLLK